MAAEAGQALLKALRNDEVKNGADAVDLKASDGDVRVSRFLACTLSPVLRAALGGTFSESTTGVYEVREHSAAHVRFAFDFLCGDEKRLIDGENGVALLYLADVLGLNTLKSACATRLITLTTRPARTPTAPRCASAAPLGRTARSRARPSPGCRSCRDTGAGART